jgi:hypothetical protein
MISRPILFQGAMVRALLDGSKTQTRRVVKPQPPAWASEYWGTVGTYSGLSEPIYYWQGVHPEYPEEGPLLWPAEDKWNEEPQWDRFEGTGLVSPYGSQKNCLKQAGQLWVRETYFAFGRWETRFSAKKKRDEWHFVDMTLECGHPYSYAESGNHPLPMRGGRDAGVTPGWWKRPAIFMPRAASRITLEITGVRVERLQDIHEADAKAEGITIRPECMQSPAVAIYSMLWEDINGPNSWAENPWVWVVEFTRHNAGDKRGA